MESGEAIARLLTYVILADCYLVIQRERERENSSEREREVEKIKISHIAR